MVEYSNSFEKTNGGKRSTDSRYPEVKPDKISQSKQLPKIDSRK
jgi:hypothetical protein